MLQSWHTLLANLAVVSIVVTLWTQSREPLSRLDRPYRTLFSAVLFAGGILVTMSLPFQVRPGLYADLCSTFTVLAVFFDGPVVGAATLATGVCYRLWVGGFGAPTAIFTLGLVFCIGLVGRAILRARDPSYPDVAALAAVTTTGALAGFLFCRPRSALTCSSTSCLRSPA